MFRRMVGELVKRQPVTVPMDAPLSLAVARMREGPLSCLIVTDGRKVVGIVTERDVVRHVDAPAVADMPVAEVMSTPVAGILKNLPMDEAVKLMVERRIRHLAVLDTGAGIDGVVTDTDLVDALAVDFMVDNVPCATLSHAEVTVVEPGVSVHEAISVMRLKHIGCVVVADGGTPVGVLTERDLVDKVFGSAAVLAGPVAEAMRCPANVVPVDAVVYKVILYMRRRGMRRAVMVDESGRLAGILTQRDLLAYGRKFG